MKTQYYVVSEYDRLDDLLRPEDRRIEIDRREFDREEDAVAFAKSLPCDIYAEPLDEADRSAVYAIRHTAYRVDLDYDGFPMDTALIGCRRLPDEKLPGAVKAHLQSDGAGKKYKGRWFSARSLPTELQTDRSGQVDSVPVSLRLPTALFQRLAGLAAACGQCPDELIRDILMREINNNDPENRPDPSASKSEAVMPNSGMGMDWEE